MIPQPTKLSTGVAAVVAAATFKLAFPTRKNAQTPMYQLVYFASLGAALTGTYSLYRDGELPFLGDGFDGYGGVARKIRRLEKKLARLEKRLAKKEAKGRTKAVARIMRKIDKFRAKLDALQGQAGDEGIPGYSTMSPMPLPEPLPDPMPVEQYDVESDAGGGMPSWALPAALGGGVLLVVGAVMLSGGGRE